MARPGDLCLLPSTGSLKVRCSSYAEKTIDKQDSRSSARCAASSGYGKKPQVQRTRSDCIGGALHFRNRGRRRAGFNASLNVFANKQDSALFQKIRPSGPASYFLPFSFAFSISPLIPSGAFGNLYPRASSNPHSRPDLLNSKPAVLKSESYIGRFSSNRK